jgi:predicted RNA binding protein YcfA (HicA-like mRNA interferase family)
MTAREVVRKILAKGGRFVRQPSAHAIYECKCGKWKTTVSMHKGDIKKGTLHGIEKDLEPCFGAGWLTKK